MDGGRWAGPLIASFVYSFSAFVDVTSSFADPEINFWSPVITHKSINSVTICRSDLLYTTRPVGQDLDWQETCSGTRI